MDTIEELLEFVAHQVTVSETHAVTSTLMTSGGPAEDVWCESPEKAIELWCYEFAKLSKSEPGDLLWGVKPEMRQKKFFTQKSTNYLDTKILYTVYSRLELRPFPRLMHADAGLQANA